jgi:nitrogen fixation protein FixH
MTADFVSQRGGGLLVLGARSFDRSGLIGTPLEEVLPVDFTDRRVAARGPVQSTPAANAISITNDGAVHPAMRLAVSVDDSRKKWAQLPPMASATALGAPRAGAQVLAVTSAGGEVRPVVVTQRYGQGRSMVFAGEASWRWRMLLPSTDNTFEMAWRQMTRWIASGATDPVEIPPTSVTLPGTTETLSVLVRDEEFKPVGDAEVMLHVKEPGGQERSVSAALSDPQSGRYTAGVRFDQAGVYLVAADVKRGAQSLARVSRPLLVGGADLEMTEPRLNEAVLRRISETSGGKYLPAARAAEVPSLIRAADIESPPMEMRDVWDNGWTLVMIIALLGAEWILRRRVGLA